MDVCQKIDAQLKERNMSRRKLAIEAGIPPSTLQSALSRKGSITMGMLQRIAFVFDVTLGDLLDKEILVPNPNLYTKEEKDWMLRGIYHATPMPKPDSDTRLTISLIDDLELIEEGMKRGDKDAESAYLTIQKMMGRIETTKEERQATIDYIRRAREQKAGEDNAPQE